MATGDDEKRAAVERERQELAEQVCEAMRFITQSSQAPNGDPWLAVWWLCTRYPKRYGRFPLSPDVLEFASMRGKVGQAERRAEILEERVAVLEQRLAALCRSLGVEGESDEQRGG